MNTRSTAKTKHFLDTSVARAIVLGIPVVRQYYERQFGDEELYISPYIIMEFARGFVRALIDFYLTLDMPHIHTVTEAKNLWSESFQPRKLKAILQVPDEIFAANEIRFNAPTDKQLALRALASYIFDISRQFVHAFRNTGIDSTRCLRHGELVLHSNDVRGSLQKYAQALDQLTSSARKCRVEDIFLSKHRIAAEKFVSLAANAEGQDAKGFRAIAESIKQVLKKGEGACTCRMCDKVGDAVIALDVPKNMILEHTDRSYDYLCPPIDLDHRRHPPATTIVSEA